VKGLSTLERLDQNTRHPKMEILITTVSTRACQVAWGNQGIFVSLADARVFEGAMTP
jgi:hypothetical protein